jgi:membrane protease YdiL (CAAX protease family)
MFMNENLENQPKHSSDNNSEEMISNMNPITAAFLGLAGVFVLYQFGGALLTLAIFGLNFEKANVNLIRLLTVGGQILFILLPALMLSKSVYRNVTSALRIKLPKAKEILLFIVGLIILTPLLQSFLYIQNYFINVFTGYSSFLKSIKDLVDQLDKLVQSAYGDLLVSHSIFESSFIVFVVAVIPALCEETFFRGFVQKSFEQKYKPIFSAFLTAIFFGIYHFNPYGLLALIALGTYFGFAAYTSNSIMVPMALHFLNNLFAVILFLVLGDKELISSNVAPTGNIINHLIMFFVLLIIFSGFIIYLKKALLIINTPKEPL